MYGSRIRYIEGSTEGELKSLRSFNGISVRLYPDTKQFHLIKDGNILESGSANGGLHKLKIAAKKALENKGIVFNKEARKVNQGE